MANAETTVTCDQVTDAIVLAISGQFPDLATVEAYPEDQAKVTTPAVLVELEEMEPAMDDPGTEQLSMRMRWVAHIVLGFRERPTVKRKSRSLAAALATFVKLNRFGLPIGPAELLGAYPDDFTPELAQYEAWRVEWTCTADFGESVWDGAGVVPEIIMLGFAPDIGAGHEDDYMQVAGLPETTP